MRTVDFGMPETVQIRRRHEGGRRIRGNLLLDGPNHVARADGRQFEKAVVLGLDSLQELVGVLAFVAPETQLVFQLVVKQKPTVRTLLVSGL